MTKNVVLLLLFVIAIACSKIKSYPDQPMVSFKEFNYTDTSLILNFIDGDGNFGFDSKDTLAEKDTSDSIYNVFTPIEKKENGKYIPILTQSKWAFRITDIPIPQGQNKTLKGNIKIKFNWIPISFLPDTFRFKYWIVDSKWNKSNVDSTPDLIKSQIGKKVGLP